MQNIESLSRRTFLQKVRRALITAGIGSPLLSFTSLEDSARAVPPKDSVELYWWYGFPSFTQVDNPDVFGRTCARMDIHGFASDPTWGPYAQRLRILEAGSSFRQIKKQGARVITWIEGFGDCMLYAITLERLPDGAFAHRQDDPVLPQVMRSHWAWANSTIPQGNTFRWVGVHNTVNDEDFIPAGLTRQARGLPVPTYPDGRPALGWLREGHYPLNARIYDACGAKDINGSLHASFEPTSGVNGPPSDQRYQQGLYPAFPGRDDVAAVPGVKVGNPVYCGVISVHKDLSAPFWREYVRESVRELVIAGLDGVWCDNYSPWDNFGYPPIQKAFGEWSLHRFHQHLHQHPSIVGALPATFDLRTYLKEKAVSFGARDPSQYDDPAWRDSRWLEEPVWNAFKAFRQASAREDLKAFYQAIHGEARKVGKTDFCIGGNDIPFYGLGWVQDQWLDMVNTELTPGWHMGTGSRGIGIPPVGKMAVVYRAALEHQKGPFCAGWYYLNGAYEKYQQKEEIGRVLVAEAFANGAFLMCAPENKQVAGTLETHAWWNQFIRKTEHEYGRRVPLADVGILFSPDNQLYQLAPGGFPEMDHQPQIFGYYGWATAMVDAHIPYRAVTDWKLNASHLEGLRILILPDIECLEEGALTSLESWVRAGGRLVVTGNLGVRGGPSGHFRKRKGGRSLLDIQLINTEAETHRQIGRGGVHRIARAIGMEYYLQEKDRSSLLPQMVGTVGDSSLVDGSHLPTTVGLSSWRSLDGRTLFADLVNYNLDADQDRVTPAAELEFRIRLPLGSPSVQFRTLSPDEEAPAKVRIEGGWASIQLPRLLHFASVKLLLLLGLVLLLTTAQARAVVFVSGAVVSKAKNAPLAGVTLSLYTEEQAAILPTAETATVATTQTVQNGAYILKAPAPGRYRLTVVGGDYLPLDRTVVIPPSGLANLDFSMPAVPSLHLKLLGPEGKPVIGGNVWGWIWVLWGERGGVILPLNKVDSQRSAGIPVPASGVLEVPGPKGLPLGSATAIRVDVRVHGVGVGATRMDHWTEDPITIGLGKGATVEGTVTDAAGKPAHNIHVLAIRALQEGMSLSPPAPVQASTDANGHFEIPGLFHDLYQVMALYPDWGARYQMVSLFQDRVEVKLTPTNPTTSVEGAQNTYAGQAPLAAMLERLDPARARTMAAISGKVLDRSTGDPLKDVSVSLYTPGVLQPVSLTQSLADGSYTIKAPPLRTYGLRVETSNHLLLQKTLEVPGRGLPGLDLRLSPIPTAHIKLVSASGNPIVKGPIQVYLSVNWGQNITETAIDLKSAPGGMVELRAPRWDYALGETSTDDPTNIVMGARHGTVGYGEVRLDHWPEGTVVLPLRRARRLSGLAVDKAGKPLPRIAITLSRTAHTPGPGQEPALPILVSTTTDDKGRFELPFLPGGTYSIVETYNGDAFRAAIINLSQDRTEITVRPPG